jgi:hypothetical protein
LDALPGFGVFTKCIEAVSNSPVLIVFSNRIIHAKEDGVLQGSISA